MSDSQDTSVADSRLFRRVAIGATIATPIIVVLTALLSSMASDAGTAVHIGVGVFGGVVAGPFFGSAIAVGYHQLTEGGH